MTKAFITMPTANTRPLLDLTTHLVCTQEQGPILGVS